MVRLVGTALIVTALFVGVIQGVGFAVVGRMPEVDVRSILLPFFGTDGVLPWREYLGFLAPLYDSAAGRLLGAPFAACCLIGGAAMVSLTRGD